MAEQPDLSLVLSILRNIQDDQRGIREDQRDMRESLTRLEEGQVKILYELSGNTRLIRGLAADLAALESRVEALEAAR